MAPKIPEFILRNMVVKDSLKPQNGGFTFQLKNSYAPATITTIQVESGGKVFATEDITLTLEGESPVQADSISPENPFPLPVGKVLTIRVDNHQQPETPIRLSVKTKEAGKLRLTIEAGSAVKTPSRYPRENIFKRLVSSALHAQAIVNLDHVIGEIDPHIYGHFVEHLEDCIYGGIFTTDGSQMNPDVVDLVRALEPPLIRYPGGNYASDYHWEEGIGPKDERPVHYDRAWHSEDPNLVGTDEMMAFCRAVGAEPYLVINDASGSPEEAARWVAYCNDPPDTDPGARRAANGHPDPYHVKIWGLGNEVWGEWQVGHTSARGYVERIRPFIERMHDIDPSIKLVAVGLDYLQDDPRGAIDWNRTVLEGIGDSIDYVSFHLYQPSEEGYREEYDPEVLYHSIVAAPHSAENAIIRMAEQIQFLKPNRPIGIALDEYNVKLPPPANAESMHDLTYTLRDGLYVAGMLNTFHRQCNMLKIANIALLVNTLPVIEKPPSQPAFPTPLYFPFKLYKQMESQALDVAIWSPYYQIGSLGLNIEASDQVPYLDITATRSPDGNRLVLGILNRHPLKTAKVMINLKGEGNRAYRSRDSWLMSGPDPLAANTIKTPNAVGIRRVKPAPSRYGWLDVSLPAASLNVLTLEK